MLERFMEWKENGKIIEGDGEDGAGQPVHAKGKVFQLFQADGPVRDQGPWWARIMEKDEKAKLVKVDTFKPVN